jgi:hypothetical protein
LSCVCEVFGSCDGSRSCDVSDDSLQVAGQTHGLLYALKETRPSPFRETRMRCQDPLNHLFMAVFGHSLPMQWLLLAQFIILCERWRCFVLCSYFHFIWY